MKSLPHEINIDTAGFSIFFSSVLWILVVGRWVVALRLRFQIRKRDANNPSLAVHDTSLLDKKNTKFTRRNHKLKYTEYGIERHIIYFNMVYIKHW